MTSVKLDEVNKRIINKAEKEEILNAKQPDQPPEQIQIQSVEKTSASKPVEQVATIPTATKNKPKSRIDSLKYVALLDVGEKYDATVFYVSDQKQLFLVENSQISQIAEIQEHINNEEFLTKKTTSASISSLNNTDLVIALYDADETWYRAIVIDNKTTEENKIKLFFVDYGNEEYIKLENIRVVTSNEDKIFHQTFKINNCDLNLADNLTANNNKHVIEQLKKLEGTSVIIKVLNLGKLSLNTKLSVENYIRNYVVTLYMDKNDETNNEQRLLKILSTNQQQPQQANKTNVNLEQFADAEEKSKVKTESQRYLKLSKNTTYKVNIQYIDQAASIIYLYLSENAEKLNQLQMFLQNAIENGFEYINSVNEIDTNEQYEALYKEDFKWYRCIVTKISKNAVDVYFVDYGNLEILDLQEVKLSDYLRKRKANKKDEIYKIEYQAIKCKYIKSFEQFADEIPAFIGETNDNESFYIKCVDSNENEFVFELTTHENENDKEVSEILESKRPQPDKKEIKTYAPLFSGCIENSLINLDANTAEPKEITLVYINSTNEVYVQLNENFDLLITYQQHLQLIMNSLVQSTDDRTGGVFKVGDYVIAKFSYDLSWYRGIVLETPQPDKYEIYFVDYGNKEVVEKDSIYSVNDLIKVVKEDSSDSNNNQNCAFTYETINSIVNFKFQAILCKLDKVKTCARNTDSLKSLMNECFNFHMKMQSIDKCFIGGVVESLNTNLARVNKYSIQLYSDGELLNDKFERDLKLEVVKEEPDLNLKVGEVYTCKYASIESLEEFYVQLINNSAQLEAMEKYLTELTEKPSGLFEKFKSLPANNQIVLAKFEGIWYRAKIVDAKDKNNIKVFFIDYGNVDENSNLDSLLNINEANIDELDLPPLAYCIRLNKVKIDIEKHKDVLASMLELENISVKCISIDKNDNKVVYNVELYDPSQTNISYNQLIDQSYCLEPKQEYHIDHSNIVVDKSKLFTAEYRCFDELEKPIYLSSSEDLLKCEKLSLDLNDYYKKNSNLENIKNENEIKIGEYYAIKHEDNNWYRVKLTGIDKNAKLIDCRLIDFGCVEKDMKYFSNNEFLIKKLNKMFQTQHRYVFRACLIDLSSEEPKTLEFKNPDKITEHIESFFFDNISENKMKQVKIKVISSFGNDTEDSDYIYGIEILNNKNESLNKLIQTENEALKKPISVDKFYKINLKQIPKQKFDSKQIHHLFVKSIGCFYAFDENLVKKIQEDGEETCSSILGLNYEFNFKTNATNLPEIGNLIFANYDECSYRCEIKNVDENFERFELFFIDFGNIEIVNKADIILPFTEKHAECFTKYAPQAYKSKLYGLKDEESNSDSFRNYARDKKFRVKLIKKFVDANEIITHEVQLMLQDSKFDVHEYLIENNYAKFKPLEDILNSIKTNEEIEFYMERFNTLKKKLGI